MTENYKHLYEQAKKVIVMYQDEIVPGFREKIEDMEKNMAEVVRCKDCRYWVENRGDSFCASHDGLFAHTKPDDFCSYGERKDE